MKKPVTLLMLIFWFGFTVAQNEKQLMTDPFVFKYTSYVDHIDQELYTKQYSRSFDTMGIITQNKEYHALTIAGYGIMNYENFVTSGDSTYFQNAINQYKYFCDSTKVVYIDNYKGMGLPYRFRFRDLKPPWYSGMTQGVGISFMLRFYLLTGNKEALVKAQQLAYFMLRSEEVGGTIGKTPEGFTFIEEYPNSRSNPQVLNGFINGLIGLREYLNFFPEDTLAQRIHDESYDAMIKTFKEYDLPNNWTTYNRGKKRITNFYLRYQITELELLNFIYNDYRIVKQMMLWSYFAYNHLEKNLPDFINPLYEYAVPLKTDKNKISSENFDFEKTLSPCTNYSISRNSKNSGHLLKHKKTYKIELEDSVYSFHIFFDKNIESAIWEINKEKILESPDSVKLEFDSTRMVVTSKEKIKKLEIKFSNKKQKKLKLTDLQTYNPYQFDIPRFAFYNFVSVQELHADSLYTIDTKGDYLNETIVFYRYSVNKESLKNAKYEINNTISLSNPYFIPQKTGVYQFFLATPAIKGYWLEKPSVKLVQK